MTSPSPRWCSGRCRALSTPPPHRASAPTPASSSRGRRTSGGPRRRRSPPRASGEAKRTGLLAQIRELPARHLVQADLGGRRAPVDTGSGLGSRLEPTTAILCRQRRSMGCFSYLRDWSGTGRNANLGREAVSNATEAGGEPGPRISRPADSRTYMRPALTWLAASVHRSTRRGLRDSVGKLLKRPPQVRSVRWGTFRLGPRSVPRSPGGRRLPERRALPGSAVERATRESRQERMRARTWTICNGCWRPPPRGKVWTASRW